MGGAYLGGAGVAGAAASCVAGGGAGVSAVGPRDGAGLAAPPLPQAVATVTDALAVVHLAGQRLVAGQPTRCPAGGRRCCCVAAGHSQTR